MLDPSQQDRQRTGKALFIEQLIAAGTKYIFGNPGTTEQAIIDAVQDYPEIEFIVGLHEMTAMGMAESYARATRQPAIVQLHAGPGLGNAMGMIYNAWSANIPMVIFACVGSAEGLYQEPALAGPLLQMAVPLCKWATEVRFAHEIPSVLRRALKVAREGPQGPVVLIITADALEAESDAQVLPVTYVRERARPDLEALSEAVDLVMAAERPALFIADGISHAGAVELVGELAEAIGCPVYQGYTNDVNIDAGHRLNAGGIPVFYPKPFRDALAQHDVLLAIGTEVFRVMFAERDVPAPPNLKIVHIHNDSNQLAKLLPSLAIKADPKSAIEDMLVMIAERETAPRRERVARRADEAAEHIAQKRAAILEADKARWDVSPMTPARAVAEIADALPSNAIVYDEAVSASVEIIKYLRPSPGQWFRAAGGGLGPGATGPVGMKLAHPERPAFAIVGDGSILYTITALWSAAHHRIPAIWIVLNNASYKVLKLNLLAYRQGHDAGRPFVGTDLDDPAIDYVALARSLGVEARSIDRPEDIANAIDWAVANQRPTLLNVVVNRDL